MKKIFSPSGILCVLVLAVMFAGGASMVYGTFFKTQTAVSSSSAVNFREEYPFENAAPAVPATPAPAAELSFTEKIKKIENKIDNSKNNIIGKERFLELCGAYRRLTMQTETKNIVLLNNGMLTTIVDKTAPEKAERIAGSIIAFKDSTEEAGVPFLFIQEPQKVCKYDDEMPAGKYSYINDNLDEHLKLLEAGGVETFDLREGIHEAGLDHYSLFFRTDHHWTMEAALKATRIIAAELNDRYGYGFDLSLLDDENYNFDTKSRWYLGAQGRNVTLGYISPDDFTVVTPKYETSFTVEHPDKALTLEGDFYETMFDHEMLSTKGYYDKSTYEAILYGNRPLTRIVNHNSDGPKIMLLHDSYAASVAPFLSLFCSEVDLVDVRPANGNFNGSLDAFRDETEPDLVLLMFCSPENINRSKG